MVYPAGRTSTVTWETIAHVDPPPPQAAEDRQLIFYLGPNHYPAGLYLPLGYELESRDGDEGWKVLRARDTLTHQILTIWGVNEDTEASERVRILEP